MDWEALGAIGEVPGFLLVLATLVCVAVQTPELNKQSQAEARYTLLPAIPRLFAADTRSSIVKTFFCRLLSQPKHQLVRL
jgi:hypothetical protein